MKALKFRVLLDSDKNEEIFRDILISEDDNFEFFHNAIISSFGFKGDQMSSFYMSDEEWEKGFEINLVDMGFDDEDGLPSVMNKAILKDFMEDHNQKMILVYDFLKMWCFLIELLETSEYKGKDLPKVVLEIGVAPDENEENNEGKILHGEDLSGDLDDFDNEFGEDFDSLDDFDDIEDESSFY